MNEDKLKEFLKELMVWTLDNRPDVNIMLTKKLNDTFKEQKK